MKKFTAIVTAATIAILTVAPAHAQMSGLAVKAPTVAAGQEIVHKTGSRRGGKVAAGIALGILGVAAIAAANSRQSYAEERYEDDYNRRCRRWMYRCEDGSNRACRKYDRHC